MKTTVDISDDLLAAAREEAAAKRTSVKALIEMGLRHVLQQRSKKRRFRLRDASVSGRGLSPEIVEGSWEEVRDVIYRGRGA